MSTEDSSADDLSPTGIDPSVSRLIFLAMLGLMAGGFVAFRMLSKPVGPPPPEVAKDALLTQGRAIYLARCVACHGNDGRGDGPLAANLIGPPVGNLTDKRMEARRSSRPGDRRDRPGRAQHAHGRLGPRARSARDQGRRGVCLLSWRRRAVPGELPGRPE